MALTIELDAATAEALRELSAEQQRSTDDVVRDATSSILDEAPLAGSLSIFDLGHFSLERFRTWQTAGAHWISRGISDMLLTVDGQTHDLHEWLEAQPPGRIDRWVEVGAARLRWISDTIRLHWLPVRLDFFGE